MADRAELVVFWILAVPLLISAVGVVASRNPVHSAMSLVAAFFFLAGIYVVLVAHLVAFLQVLVYAGAIMVLFVFVVMVLNRDEADPIQQPARQAVPKYTPILRTDFDSRLTQQDPRQRLKR